MDDQAVGDTDRAERVPAPARSIAGEFVTTTFAYDGGRRVTVYLPPDPPEAVVYAGDGQLIAGWGGLLEAADAVPTVVVGCRAGSRVPI